MDVLLAPRSDTRARTIQLLAISFVSNFLSRAELRRRGSVIADLIGGALADTDATWEERANAFDAATQLQGQCVLRRLPLAPIVRGLNAVAGEREFWNTMAVLCPMDHGKFPKYVKSSNKLSE